MSDIKAMADQVFEAVKQYIARPIAELEKRLTDKINGLPVAEKGEPGKDGTDGKDGAAGKDGKDVEPEVVRTMVDDAVATAVAGIPVPKDGEPGKDGLPGERGADGKDGAPGADGKSVDEEQIDVIVSEMVSEQIRNAVALIPKAKDGEKGLDGIPGERGSDGRDGRDGTDGPVGKDALSIEILPSIDEKCSYPRGTYASYKGGIVYAERATDPIIDVIPLDAGWRVIVEGVAEEEETYSEDGRTITRTTTYTSGKKMLRTLKTAMAIYRGLWLGGEYERGDMVTRGGSVWHCQVDSTKSEPVEGNEDWKLAVKRGRDGREPEREKKYNGESPVVRIQSPRA